jgi:hypothetical protein
MLNANGRLAYAVFKLTVYIYIYIYYHLGLLVCSYFSMGYLSDIVELFLLGLVEIREDNIGVSIYKL